MGSSFSASATLVATRKKISRLNDRVDQRNHGDLHHLVAFFDLYRHDQEAPGVLVGTHGRPSSLLRLGGGQRVIDIGTPPFLNQGPDGVGAIVVIDLVVAGHLDDRGGQRLLVADGQLPRTALEAFECAALASGPDPRPAGTS